MRTVKLNPILSGAIVALGTVVMVAGAARAQDISSTNPAAILVFPKLAYDSTAGVDTTIQVSNTSDSPVNVRCFYVNANGHCSNAPFAICDPSGVNTCEMGVCVPGCQETDFAFRLTSKQPIVWTFGAGLADLPLANAPGPKGEFNFGSIPPAPEDPMIGELKCVQVGEDELPIDQNSLKGEATIATAQQGLDIRGYNAVGLRAQEGANNRDNTLVLGTEYAGCPNILIIDHFFDNAVSPTADAATVTTDLTLVPCSEDFNYQIPRTVVAQYLVFNEFEQRFSTSRSVTCLQEIPLSDIDTRPGPGDNGFSIFNVAVQGTLTGQTTIRGVQTADETAGTGLLAVVEEFHQASSGTYSSASESHFRGSRTQRDVILLPAAQPSGL